MTSKEETPLEKIRFWEGVAIEGTVVHDLAKTAIAEIERLTKALTTANANHEHFERLYYLEIQKHESSVETSEQPVHSSLVGLSRADQTKLIEHLWEASDGCERCAVKFRALRLSSPVETFCEHPKEDR